MRTSWLARIAVLLSPACGPGTPTDTAPPTETDADADTDTDTDADTDTDTDTGLPRDPATVPLRGACPLDAAWGAFGVASDGALTVVSGAVANGVVPITILEEVGRAGDCALLRRNNPFCDPACGPDETCDFDGSCLPYPVTQDLGTVWVDGLLAPVEMTPSPPGFNYYALGLPHPAYTPGALITLRTEGGPFGALRLHGVGLTPLPPPPGERVLDPGRDFTLTWPAPGDGDRSTITMRVTIDQHGVTPVQLVCSFADTGIGTVPGSLVEDFVAFGVTGFPSATLIRQTVDSTTVDEGCVAFSVAWSHRMALRVQGFVPCSTQEDCPTGLVCNTTLEICE